MATWSNSSLDFCSWQGISCSRQQGRPRRVIALDLEGEGIIGEIPPCISNLSYLARIHLPFNQFHGSMPPTLGQLSMLKYINLSSNALSGEIPAELSSCSQLQVLALRNNRYLGLGNNGFVGRLPSTMGNTLPKIEKIIMSVNNLDGEIPRSLANATNIVYIFLAQNSFSGVIPPLGTLLNLQALFLFENGKLEAGDWSFLSSLTSCTQLSYLELDGNNLQGNFPSSLTNLSRNMEYLTLGSNHITGSVPPGIANLDCLSFLYLDNNMLTGPVPDSIGKISSMFGLDLSKNKFYGNIPASLEENRLSGVIPAELAGCQKLVAMNLSFNTLSGSIPQGLFGKLNQLNLFLDLSNNQLTHSIPDDFGSLINLESLNISNNNISGKIPSNLGSCVLLQELRLERNLLEGQIPSSLAALKGIKEMDFSQNNLSGSIPEFFDMFNGLQYLNLSFNNLDGPIPTKGIFANNAPVAVKVFKHEQSGAYKSFLAECRALRNIRHRNLVKVITACSTHQNSTSLIGPRGSVGYIPPEYGMGSRISTEGDVYSYGIVLLEMLTGKRPTDELFEDGFTLHKYVEEALPQIDEILDPDISKEIGGDHDSHTQSHEQGNKTEVQKCVMQLLNLGLLCSKEAPKDRPNIQDIYSEVVAVKEHFFSISLKET
ncbi:hypothetical protein HU200_053493 [Digitaria exilis]|uniref:non-specific serine/threonine protein kinase n=1 Tax=Digitaria exilis TaxID=1010633 RepID=A0A835ARD3_9POAL|nr:hypothetical protein HU200_053493 [Digitaria exilis]